MVMEYDTFEVNANNYPVLIRNEKIVNRQNNVTLIIGKVKYQRGLVYLTTYRILWFKSAFNQNTAIAFNLEDIQSIEINSNILSASTIKLVLLKKNKQNTQTSTEDISQTKRQVVEEKEWECQICSQMNTGNLKECMLCGVPKPSVEESESSDSDEEIDIMQLKRLPNNPNQFNSTLAGNSLNNTNNSNSGQHYGVGTSTSTGYGLNAMPTQPVKIECPACTFINDGPVEFCIVCMTKISDVTPLPSKQKITCLVCMYPNEPNTTMCSICATPLPQQPQTPPAPSYSIYNTNNFGYPNPYDNIGNNNNNMGINNRGYEISTSASTYSATTTTTTTTKIQPLPKSPQSPQSQISPHSSINSGISSNSFKTTAASSKDTYKIKLLFKNGQSQFHQELCVTLKQKQWKVQSEEIKESKSVRIGVAGVIQKMKENQKMTNETMNEAFQDLNNLMIKASEMVKIADSISQKIIKDKSMENSSEQNQLNELLEDLGISNPVTKKSIGSGNKYYQELSKQLANFVIKFLDKHNNVMTLPDVYCLFNRARGVELVSPEDLYKACNLFSKLQIPLKLRRFKSGLLIIESDSKNDDETISQICSYIKNNSNNNTKGINSVEISKELKIPVVLANEYLMLAENSSYICRDDTIEGIYYYINIFDTFDLENI